MTTKQISHEKNRSQTRYGSNKGRIVSMAVVVASIGLAVMVATLSSMLVQEVDALTRPQIGGISEWDFKAEPQDGEDVDMGSKLRKATDTSVTNPQIGGISEWD